MVQWEGSLGCRWASAKRTLGIWCLVAATWPQSRRASPTRIGTETRERGRAPIAFASRSYADVHLLTPLFACRVRNGRIEPREGQAIRWVFPARLADLPMPPADSPLVALVRDLV
jgi:hypothetical protein